MFRIFLTNLGKYNEGELVGEWVDLPVDDDFEQAFKDIGINDQYEEWFITDYENDYGYRVSEYENIFELNELAERLENLDDAEKMAVEAYCDGVNDDLDEALECAENGDYSIYYDCFNMEQVAMQWVEDCGGIEYAVREPENFFDFASYGSACRDDLDNMAYDDWEYEHPDEDDEDAEEFESPYDSYSDYELGEMIIYDMYGGFEYIDKDTIEDYFDFEALGRELDIEGTFVRVGDNYVEIRY